MEHTRQVRIEELVAHRAFGKLVRVTVLDGEEGRTDRKNTDASDGVCRILEALKDRTWHVLVLVPLLDPADEVAILEEDAECVLLTVESVAEELDGVRQLLNLHTVLSVCQIFPFLAAVEVIPSHGLHSQRQQHRVRRDLQIVAIEVIDHSADVAEAQIGEDERSDELLLRLARCKEHDQVADARHGEDVQNGETEEVNHAEHAHSQVDRVAQLGPTHAEMKEPSNRQHAQPDKKQANLVHGEIQCDCDRLHAVIINELASAR